MKLIHIHKKYIEGTEKKALVVNLTVQLCTLTNAVVKGGKFKTNRVYVTTRMLKHMYDKRPAEEYDFLVKNLYKIARYPDHIYKNKSSKRGNFCFVKTLKGDKYVCSVEATSEVNPSDGEEGMNFVATAFRLNKESYLNSYKLKWSWEGDIPPS
jgi:hypothetical protein